MTRNRYALIMTLLCAMLASVVVIDHINVVQAQDANRRPVVTPVTKVGHSGLLINLTKGTDDLHAATMALQLANHGLDAKREVTIFLNVRAPELATRTLGDEAKFGDNPPLREMLEALIERGATVIVCPSCMAAMAIEPDQFANGITTASRESLFGALKPNTAVFSY